MFFHYDDNLLYLYSICENPEWCAAQANACLPKYDYGYIDAIKTKYQRDESVMAPLSLAFILRRWNFLNTSLQVLDTLLHFWVLILSILHHSFFFFNRLQDATNCKFLGIGTRVKELFNNSSFWVRQFDDCRYIRWAH